MKTAAQKAKEQADRINGLKPKEQKMFQLENDYIGFLSSIHGQQYFAFFTTAFKALIERIEDSPETLAQFPKANWAIGYRDGEKWVSVFKISTATIRKLKKENLFP